MSDHQRKRTGETRPSRQKDATKTPTKAAAPFKPQWLKGHAATTWRHIIPLLVAQGTVAKCDRNLIIRYCITYQKWREVAQSYAQAAESIEVLGSEENGRIFRQFKDLSAQLQTREDKLGMSPAARQRLAAMEEGSDADEPDSDLD